METIRISFLGFDHFHIPLFFQQLHHRQDIEIVGAAEETPTVRNELEAKGFMFSDQTYEALLEKPSDIICIGTVFSDHARWILKALRKGFHVIVDKPLCITLEEFEEIQQAVRETGKQLFVLFSLREEPSFMTLRHLFLSNAYGKPLSMTITANHPLIISGRPSWYWNPQIHGGTINDIGCHAFDLVPWVTNRKVTAITGAYAASTICSGKAKEFPNIAQIMFSLEGNVSCMVDVSYSSPDALLYRAKSYWRIIACTEKAIIECGINEPLRITSDDPNNAFCPRPATEESRTVIDALIRAINGCPQIGDLTTKESLEASRLALLADKWRS